MARSRLNSRLRKMLGSQAQVARGDCVDNPESSSNILSSDDCSTDLDKQPTNNLATPLLSQTDNAYV